MKFQNTNQNVEGFGFVSRRTLLKSLAGIISIAPSVIPILSRNPVAKAANTKAFVPYLTSLSYRDSLHQIGEAQPHLPIPTFRHGFYSSPPSLRTAMRAMKDPQISRSYNSHEKSFKENWTDECQGVATDGTYWYISCDDHDRFLTHRGGPSSDRGIYRFTLGMKRAGYLHIPAQYGDHLGALDYYDGIIYAAMQGPLGIITIDAKNFDTSTSFGYIGVDEGEKDIFPWCAINPWNGYLYTSFFGGDNAPDTTEVFGYDLSQPPRYKSYPKIGTRRVLDVSDHAGVIKLGTAVKSVQGGCFTKNGHLLLSSSHSNDIRCYSVLNGAYLGSVPIEANGGQEVEGLTCFQSISYNNIPTQIHVILLETHWGGNDRIFFKHYTVPDNVNL